MTLVRVREGPFWEFVFRGPSGGLGEMTLDEEELTGIEILASSANRLFDGDPRCFRLGVEAWRIENAFRHDMPGLAVSRISPLPHQLDAVYGTFLEEPVLRFLLADDPGAGKTIMAGLYIKELIVRRAADRVLIVTPANLRPQWQRELAERFGIHCVQLDSSTFDANPTQNPWDLYDFVIVSRDWLKREEVLDAFTAADKSWDLAILDEAHGYTLQVDARGRIKKRSGRYHAAEQVSEKAHRLMCLTATPHSGRNSSLWGLLRLVDRDAYGEVCPTGTIELNPQHYRKVFKEEMVDMAGNSLFKPRHPHTVAYSLAGRELDLYEAVTRFVSTELARIRGNAAAGVAGFALTTMQRRLSVASDFARQDPPGISPHVVRSLGLSRRSAHVRFDRSDTLRVTRTPDQLVAASRLSGATREIFPRYERLTFDRAAALRAPETADGAVAPEAELCGPGHPLFDAAVQAVINQTRADVEAGAVFGAPDVTTATVVFFVTADSVDGNGETAHRAFAACKRHGPPHRPEVLTARAS